MSKSPEKELNIKFHKLLTTLSDDQLVCVFDKCFQIDQQHLSRIRKINPVISMSHSIDCGFIDEFVNYGDILSFAIEVKWDWKTSPGQIQQYYRYANKDKRTGYLILITPSSTDIKVPYIKEIFQNERYVFVTWKSVFDSLTTAIQLKDTKSVIEFCFYLSEHSLHKDKLRKHKTYTLDVGLSSIIDLDISLINLTQSAQKSFQSWKSGEEFWNDVIDSIIKNTGEASFYVFRFDLYHYMFRWMFHERGIFLDPTKNNKWEYYYPYFAKRMDGYLEDKMFANMNAWYNLYLKMDLNTAVELDSWWVGITSVRTRNKLEDCYFFMTKDQRKQKLLPVKLFDKIQW